VSAKVQNGMSISYCFKEGLKYPLTMPHITFPQQSRSERQALMEKEHDEVMEKIGNIVKQDFDNTKKIERPEQILARRRKEREARNVWYRRWGRKLLGKE
jgi:hypothetical protein